MLPLIAAVPAVIGVVTTVGGSIIAGMSTALTAVSAYLIERFTIKMLVIAITLALVASWYYCVTLVLDQFLPGGAISEVFPGGNIAYDLLSRVLPANTGLCISAILCAHASVFLVRWGRFFVEILSR
jgi:type III secretory pathway component EscS